MANSAGVYSLSPLAQSDLEDIRGYTVETWSLAQAEAYHADIVAAFEDLASGRRAGRQANIREGYFKYAVGAQMSYCRHGNAEILVIRILHQRMDVNRHI